MRYFVVGPDGSKYGPADVATLNQWILEGRLLPTQSVEEEFSAARLPASAVPGIQFPVGMPATEAAAPRNPYENPPAAAGYYRPGPNYDNGQSDMTIAWVCGVVGLICCAPAAIFGLMAANRAKTKGNPSAQGAVILNWIALGLWALAILGFIFLIGLGLAVAPSGPR